MANILVVEDDSNNQRMLSYTLRKAGHEVRIAANGELGLLEIEKNKPDLIMLDVAMPVMDGLTMLRKLRAHSVFNGTPVIILTASGDDQERLITEEMGVSGFLTKPSSSRAILDLVQEIVQAGVK
ncbi:MAG: response regulator [Anaerolineales bacterium]|uniref:response regulator transcription factor n=1 Tax=Candidatus Villigracilis proximus TaxID=3140683 RepID=UPI0031346815|nr:response regulator [Anaerolineales bacterium]